MAWDQSVASACVCFAEGLDPAHPFASQRLGQPPRALQPVGAVRHHLGLLQARRRRRRIDPRGIPHRVEHSLPHRDVVVLGGESRLAYHGVDRIYPGTSTLLKNGGLKSGQSA